MILFPTNFVQSAYYLGKPVQILYMHLWICFPERCHYYSMVCLCRTFCTFFIQDQQQKAFYTSGSLPQQLREVHKEKTEDAFTQWATWELQLGCCIYSIICTLVSFLFYSCYLFCTFFSPFYSHFFSHLSVIPWAQITATDIICNVQFFSLSLKRKS